jgi:hypothetical protein
MGTEHIDPDTARMRHGLAQAGLRARTPAAEGMTMNNLVALQQPGMKVEQRKLPDGRTEIEVRWPNEAPGQVWIGSAGKN